MPEQKRSKRNRSDSNSSQSSNEGDRGAKNTDGKKICAGGFQRQHIENLSEKEAENARLQQINEQHRLRALTDLFKSNPTLISPEEIAYRQHVLPPDNMTKGDLIKPEKSKFDGMSEQQVEKAIWGDKPPSTSNQQPDYPNILETEAYDYMYPIKPHGKVDDKMDIDPDKMDID